METETLRKTSQTRQEIADLEYLAKAIIDLHIRKLEFHIQPTSVEKILFKIMEVMPPEIGEAYAVMYNAEIREQERRLYNWW